MGCQDALLGGWIFPMGLRDRSDSNNGNLWPLSAPAALGVPSFPPPPLWSSSAACGLVWRRGDLSS